MSKLSLDSLTVETFSTGDDFDTTIAAKTRYTDCGSCGIACTAIDCPVPSANYTDCGSCGIACTAVEPC
jgi:hypothetical protein